ncbi:MAG: hypothetical protein WKI04_15220 [Ferruginibacter sp.]
MFSIAREDISFWNFNFKQDGVHIYAQHDAVVHSGNGCTAEQNKKAGKQEIIKEC